MDCLFCKIIEGTIPSEKVYEDEYVLAFKDINPVAPVHVLVIPKKHIKDINDITEENSMYFGKIMLAIKEVAKICGIYDNGYRIISNIGEDGGQVIPHLHFHVLGGQKMGPKLIK
jgi:histidine triad (HIT) family protein